MVNNRCINARRIRRGGGPVRYTGWTHPTYSQSQQQYGYTTDQNAYNMNNYPQQDQNNYQGQPQYNGTTGPYANDGPAYYDATKSGRADCSCTC
jgi:hypothetical protein